MDAAITVTVSTHSHLIGRVKIVPGDLLHPMISITGSGPSASYTSREVKPPAAAVVHPEHSPDQCPDVRNIQCSLCYSFSFCIICILFITTVINIL